ncbi:MAG: N-6 DNA methylase [Candidatus Sumerlaeota bacterium]|nr:N-6 DNA methylase [Candidatus Sumerlaeota bacterium]
MRLKSAASPDLARRKASGAHYTPVPLAHFVAERLLKLTKRRVDAPLRILDPACGDGVLLEAILGCLRSAGKYRAEVYAVETDEQALEAAQARLSRFEQANLHFMAGDFLTLWRIREQQYELWETIPSSADLPEDFDVVIANPPYVRTQVLGAERSQALAERFGLSGRVDLYHAFLVAATDALRPGGAIGVIASNRFLSTMGGSSVREFLARHYDIDEIVDLGDTKLFEAAVLPAVFWGRRKQNDSKRGPRRPARFIRVYSETQASKEEAESLPAYSSVLEILDDAEPGRYRLPEGIFSLARGELAIDQNPKQVWSLATPRESDWLSQVRKNAKGCINDIAAVRVGVKTTADEVFIRSDWDDLPIELRPEPSLLHPLLRHEDACQWALPQGFQPSIRVLYPHEIINGRRRAVDLTRFPRAKAYLDAHRSRLEGRQYVIEAGRQWYEIWVPQDPLAWEEPKIVFPDISPEPRFYLDSSGSIVDGDCYWITVRPGISHDAIYLILGIANSHLMSRYHDLAFNNRLYSARRRYITQYVAKYPYPDISSPVSQEIIATVKQLVRRVRSRGNDEEARATRKRVDDLVACAFDVQSEKEV